MKRTLLRGALALACTLMTPLALAQWAPTKPVRIVVPFPAGGIVDLMSRSFTDRLSAALGQPVVIEVRPGAHSSLGNEVVARAAQALVSAKADATGTWRAAPELSRG